jgi:hypothetical protein
MLPKSNEISSTPQERLKIIPEPSKKPEKLDKLINLKSLKNAARYTQVMSHFDKKNTSEQEVRTSPKCDIIFSAHHKPLIDLVDQTYNRQKQIRCWAESKFKNNSTGVCVYNSCF